MRHRMKGRKLGRNPSHRRAMLKNLASSLFLSERDEDLDETGEDYSTYAEPNVPKVKGRVITTLQKAKTVRPLVEKCITIARKSLVAIAAAEEFATTAERGSDEWKTWRSGDQWQKWAEAMAPALNGRRRCIQLLGNKYAVEVLFDSVAERFADRDGGYTRIVRLAMPRLGDAGTRAFIEFVGENDRISQKSERPAFDDSPEAEDDAPADEEVAEDAASEEVVEEEAAE